MKTVKEIVEFLTQYPGDAKVLIHSWDCYNDEPYNREVSQQPYVEKKRSKTIIYL